MSHDTGAAKAANTQARPTMFVLDTTAIPGGPNRTHEMIVDGVKRPFTFEAAAPMELPLEIAVKFLKHDAFKRTDSAGNILPYERQPKQPDELGAGERFKLGDGQTVARFDELNNNALLQRCLELPDGEALVKSDIDPAERRAAMIKFITETMAERRKANLAKEADTDRDSFTPEAEADEGAAEAA